MASVDLELFIEKLEESLENRYNECNDASATPSSILLAVNGEGNQT
jgi:hypothetical protein